MLLIFRTVDHGPCWLKDLPEFARHTGGNFFIVSTKGDRRSLTTTGLTCRTSREFGLAKVDETTALFWSEPQTTQEFFKGDSVRNPDVIRGAIV